MRSKRIVDGVKHNVKISKKSTDTQKSNFDMNALIGRMRVANMW